MGYLSCRADSSIATCRSIAAFSPSPSSSSADRRHHKNSASGDRGSKASEDAGRGDDALPDLRARRFNYDELAAATGHFSDAALLGRGSHGSVYKATLPRLGLVAVKRPSRRPSGGGGFPSASPSPMTPARDEVENEIAVLSSLRNPRLVNLVGFTPPSAARERLLVVEFMPNGTLYDLLHSNPSRPPGWPRRLRLALQTAKALLALHSSRPPVIHRDVKSANVLLDHRLHARLGDFGLALHHGGDGDDADGANLPFPSSARCTPPAGTLGYLDPSYVTPENLSTKTDVFSFGILLLEIISGRKAIDVAHSPPSVVEWAIPLLKKGKVSPLFDPRIPPPKDPSTRRHLASLAASCVRSCKERRPSMEEIVEQLKALGKTVTLRSWNGLTVGNPCSVVDADTFLSKRESNSLHRNQSSGTVSKFNEEFDEANAADEELSVRGSKPPLIVSRPSRGGRRVFSDGSSKGSRNLKDLMARHEEEIIRGSAYGISGSNRPVISRARTLRSARDYSDPGPILRLRRNQTVRDVALKPSS